jgi:hypothetical protein
MQFEDGNVGQQVRVIPGMGTLFYPAGFVTTIDDLRVEEWGNYFGVLGIDGMQRSMVPYRFEPYMEEPKDMTDQDVADEYFRIQNEIKNLVKARNIQARILKERGFSFNWIGGPKWTKTLPPVAPTVVELLPPSA